MNKVQKKYWKDINNILILLMTQGKIMLYIFFLRLPFPNVSKLKIPFYYHKIKTQFKDA